MFGSFFIVILIVYAATNFYIARRLFQGLRARFPHLPAWLFALVYTLLALSVPGSIATLPGALQTVVGTAGAYWMGCFVYLLVFTIVADLVIGICCLCRAIKRPITPNVRWISSVCVVAATALVAAYGFINAATIRVTPYEAQAHTTAMEQPLRIALISDLHLGAVGSEQRLARTVEAINELDVDLVCIAGDLFDGNTEKLQTPEADRALLSSLKTHYGVYGCWGNHDRGLTFEQMGEFAASCGIVMLQDECITVADRLVLAGRCEGSFMGGSSETRAAQLALPEQTGTRLPVVVMDHNPAHLFEYGSDIDLLLSGHTHRGQIIPGNLITHQMYAVDYGKYVNESTGTQVIVSSGAGTWGMPFRTSGHCEVALITLE